MIRLGLPAALAAGLLALPAQATNGYFANGYGGTSKGMAGAGVAFPTGVLGIAQNPATGAKIGTTGGVCLTGFAPNRGFTIDAGGPLTAGRQESRNSFFVIPCGGFNYALGEKSAIGFLIFGNGGMNTEYAVNPFAGLAPPGAVSAPLGVNLEQLFISANFAHRFNDQLSVGIGPVLAIQRFSATGLEAFGAFSADPANVTNNGHDWSSGVGLNLGVLYEPNEQWAFGVSYRTKINMKKFDQYAGLFAGGGDFDIPANATIGAAYRPASMPALTLTAEYQRIFYGDVPAMANSGALLGATRLGDANGPGFGWKDMDVVRIAASYQANEKLTLRGGVSHASSFIDGDEVLFNVLAPATPQWHASIGVSYQISERATFTASYTHAFDAKKSGANLTPGLGQKTTLEMDQHEISMGVSWKF